MVKTLEKSFPQTTEGVLPGKVHISKGLDKHKVLRFCLGKGYNMLYFLISE